jgi:hypothetical protein
MVLEPCSQFVGVTPTGMASPSWFVFGEGAVTNKAKNKKSQPLTTTLMA